MSSLEHGSVHDFKNIILVFYQKKAIASDGFIVIVSIIQLR